MSSDRRRVVVTGIGCINPMGNDVETMWDGLKHGRSGVGPLTVFDANRFPTRIAAEIKNFDVSHYVDEPSQWKHRARHTCFAAGAAKQAVNASGCLDGSLDPTRFGVYLGSGEGNQDFLSFSNMISRGLTSDGGLDLRGFIQAGLETLNPVAELEQEPNMPAGYMASLFDAQAEYQLFDRVRAASSQAIGEATEMIRRGEVDVMLAGGTHSMIHPFGVTGFSLLTTLSTRNEEPHRASRPFDRLRDGFVLGEGAAMIVLEDLERAVKRGAPIYGEIIGYGSTADAYRITDIHPEGRGAIACMRMALADAAIAPDAVHYVNAHGTSTTVNDKVETLACRRVFGEIAEKVPVSSTKSMMGHLIAAAGVTELIVCLLAIRDQVLPPTINYENPDPACDLDYIPNEAREAKCEVALNNSFGFGGQNITIAVGKFRG